MSYGLDVENYLSVRVCSRQRLQMVHETNTVRKKKVRRTTFN